MKSRIKNIYEKTLEYAEMMCKGVVSFYYGLIEVDISLDKICDERENEPYSKYVFCEVCEKIFKVEPIQENNFKGWTWLGLNGLYHYGTCPLCYTKTVDDSS